MEIKAITFIRQNSQRLPGKSTRNLNGIPLCNYSLKTMTEVDGIDDVIVYTSDSEVVNNIDESLDISIQKRPQKFNSDSSTFSIIINEAIKLVDSKYVLYFCVTSPFIKKESIEDMIKNVKLGNYDSSFTVKNVHNFCWYNNKPINYNPHKVPFTQDLQPILEETSGLYIFEKDLYVKYKRRIGYRPYLKTVSKVEGHDIDYPIDFELAKFYLENNLA